MVILATGQIIEEQVEIYELIYLNEHDLSLATRINFVWR